MRSRMMFGALAIVAFAASLMVFVLRSIASDTQHTDQLDSMRHMTQQLADLKAANGKAWASVSAILLAPDDAAVVDGARGLVVAHDARLAAIASLEASALDIGAAEIGDAATTVERFLTALSPVRNAMDDAQGDAPAIRAIMAAAPGNADAAAAEQAETDLAAAIDQRATEIAAEAADAADWTRIVVIAGTIILVLVVVGASWATASRIASRVGNVVTGLADTTDELGELGQRLHGVADTNSERSELVAGAANVVGESIREVAIAVEQLGYSIEEIARTAADARVVAARAVDEASQTNTTVTRLGQSSAEIGEVVQLIASVAEQTNLLALNATIEAARAGEAGRGFAVVAAEVKELANQTSTATNEIASRIDAIQHETRQAVDAIGRIAQTVGDVSSLQNDIAASVEEQSLSVNEVARSMEHASSSTDQIIHGIEEVAGNSKTTTASIDQLLVAVSRLSAGAQSLHGLMGAGLVG